MQYLLTALFRRLLFALILVACASAFGMNAMAQTGASRDEVEASRRNAQVDMDNREWMLRNLGKMKRVDIDVAPPSVTLSKIKDDYIGLQKANNSILEMLSAGKELDYKLLYTSSSEIRKRASRLKSYLVMLEMVEENDKRKKNQDEIEPAQMKSSLLSLDASIVKVVANPIFKNFGKVVDADNSTKARDELDKVIELSERIKRSVERSMKAARAAR